MEAELIKTAVVPAIAEAAEMQDGINTTSICTNH
tara:strand:- start:3 stop:104 length:102 start_codon:yes stop_codon:yes gene_type:complete